jgi:hypothetical protein
VCKAKRLYSETPLFRFAGCGVFRHVAWSQGGLNRRRRRHEGFSSAEVPRVRQAEGELYTAAAPPLGPEGGALISALGGVAQAATIPTRNGATSPTSST